MYTSSEQTTKLIELGFEKPKNTQYIQRAKARNLHSPFIEFGEPEFEGSYTIGELIEMLPKSLKNSYNPPLVIECNEKWRVYYGVQADYSLEWLMWLEEERNELIDALYDMVVKLKEKGVI
jgi:hypothetical protein